MVCYFAHCVASTVNSALEVCCLSDATCEMGSLQLHKYTENTETLEKYLLCSIMSLYI